MRDEWRSLLAYCACLSECFSEEYSAGVLHDLIACHHPPDDMTPSVNEWPMFIRACGKCFSTTKFPILVEGFMRLLVETVPSQAVRANLGDYPQVRDINNVIVALSRVAKGEVMKITVVGNTFAAGWVAAVAKWLFDLPVAIQDAVGDVRHCDSARVDDAQVLILTGNGKKDNGIGLSSETYFLRGIYGFVRRMEMTVTGRLEWGECLRSTFGQDFCDLLAFSTAVGTVIGNAARIYEGIVRTEPGISAAALSRHSSYLAGSYGRGFVQNTLKWFPEIGSCENAMRSSAEFSFKDALTQYEEQRRRLEHECLCGRNCLGKERPRRRTYCLVEILDTILRLSELLSGLEIAPGLLPTRSGIRTLHLSSLGEVGPRLPGVGQISGICRGGESPKALLGSIDRAPTA
ncbi:uncharacterized protein BDV17DRAFT_290421 [Aspergillus undulatus]|uniref:uncharacterized protein n=1 Tax=Aspergillus undulatus TaxID=1810928 RepID=UPI003CCCE6E0